MQTILSMQIIALGLSQTAQPKSRYVIGAYLSEDQSQLLRDWKPILSDYLSHTVGSNYQPPIGFDLVPIDYTVNTTSVQMADNGQLDFICDSMPFFVFLILFLPGVEVI